MKETLKKIYETVTQDTREVHHRLSKNSIEITFLEAVKVEITGNQDKEYEINFINNSTGENLYGTKIKNGMWCASSIKYFVNWKVQIKSDGYIIREEILKLNNKKVKIVCDTNSMGDIIAFIGAINAFQKLHQCELHCVVFNSDVRKILELNYKNITFFPTNDTGHSYYAAYKLGYFFDWKSGTSTQDPRSTSLATIASNILGLGDIEFQPKFTCNYKNSASKKYVCIGTQSTSQSKYWNNPNGWGEVVKYLNSIGYEVWCIDKHSSFGYGEYMNYMPPGVIDKTGEVSLETRIEQLSGAEFFIGLGSGLSWLAWATGIPVVLISGFSKPWAEFFTPYRVINESVCNGCWNDTAYVFDKSSWNWCPRNKEFECTKQITPRSVIEKIDKIINTKFDFGLQSTRLKYTIQKEFFDSEKSIYQTDFDIETDDTVVDIGAQVGAFSKIALSKNPKNIFAIEPMKIYLPTLTKNISNSKVKIINSAISDGKIQTTIGFDGILENVNCITFEQFILENNIKVIDFLKVDCEGGEYDVFTEQSVDWIQKNVRKISGEWHLNSPVLKNKFRFFRDNILTKFKKYRVLSVDGIDITHFINSEEFINYYQEILIHIDNREIMVKDSFSFNYDKFFSKYKEGIQKSGESRLRFYNHIIPKLVKKNKPLYIVETGTMWAPFESNMGAFTLIMADLIKNYTGGKLYTIDISEKSINSCKQYTKDYADVIEYVTSDSISYLRSLSSEFVKSLDLVYLDSYDLYVPEPRASMQHHLNELTALYHNISEDCGIAVDDNFLPNTFIMWNWLNADGTIRDTKQFQTEDKILGKGTYCHEFLMQRGWTRFESFDIHGANNLFYYENNKLSKDKVKNIIENFYSKIPVDKPATTEFISKNNIKNSPTGLGDAIILSNLLPEKSVFSNFSQFDELMKYGKKCISSGSDAPFNISELINYDWAGGHCTQRLEKAFLGKYSLIPKPKIYAKKSVIKNKIAVHFETHSPNSEFNNISKEVQSSINKYLLENKYTVCDCSSIIDIDSLINELATCEYFIGIDSGPMHVAAALEIKSIILLNREDSNKIYLPRTRDVDIPNSEWLYPQNVHLSIKNSNELIPRFTLDSLKDALLGRVYPYFSTEYITEASSVLEKYNFDQNTNKLTFSFSRKIDSPVLILRELSTNLQCYRWEPEAFQTGIEYFVVPTQNKKLVDTDFSGFIFDVYENGQHIYSKKIFIREAQTNASKFYFDDKLALNVRDSFYVQYLDFYNNSFLNNIISEGDVIIDVGASCGTFADFCVRKNARKVVCVEPSPSFEILNKTFDSRVVCMKNALSVKNEVKDFYFTNETTLNTFDIDSQLKYDSGNCVKTYNKQPVECMTLEKLLGSVEEREIDLLKFDIEGHEYEIFKGLDTEYLAPVGKVLIEFHHNDNNQIEIILSKLQASGFFVKLLNLSYQEQDVSKNLQGVIYAYKQVPEKIKYIGLTENGMGINYELLNEQDKKISARIIESFTGLTFHNETLLVNNKCRYFTEHAYNLPNQIIKLTDYETQKPLLKKTINPSVENKFFDPINKNLYGIAPKNMRDHTVLGFSFLEIFHKKIYEMFDVKIEEGDVVFDLGANVGFFSRYAFQMGASAVYAFEPNKGLRECYESFNLNKNYKLYNNAISSSPVFFESKTTGDLAGARPIHCKGNEEDVSLNLESFITTNNINRIDYLKVDIEGGEYDLFECLSERTLGLVKKISLEYHDNEGPQVSKICNILEKNGFAIHFEQHDGMNKSLGMMCAKKL